MGSHPSSPHTISNLCLALHSDFDLLVDAFWHLWRFMGLHKQSGASDARSQRENMNLKG